MRTSSADINKVAADNPNDNCFIEFTYAHRRQARRMVTVPMEPRCLDTSKWKGHVGARPQTARA